MVNSLSNAYVNKSAPQIGAYVLKKGHFVTLNAILKVRVQIIVCKNKNNLIILNKNCNNNNLKILIN